ncbi:hypothetical protein [Paenibacillus sp. MMS18-CY102]|uniref:hypothetical protein n=1 Tax=Paenibacillus sp. MMS18-CY102 TaxID=2682849 RepID=UPI001365C78A|nr:hypothetical protein [Paenibacillus sp. MMS18-CY102]MWC26978.1 hypothetical protein [Paenibacillus sp. MMS18-CY102]
MKFKKTIATVMILGALLFLFKSDLESFALNALFNNRPEPKISSIKKYFHADEVSRIGPFSTELVATSPYMYGYWVKQGGKTSVVVLDQYWGKHNNADSNDYIIIFPQQSMTEEDNAAIGYIVTHSPMKLQTSDVIGENLVEIHKGTTVTKLPLYKLKDYTNGGNLRWLDKNLRQILTYEEGRKALLDY